MKRFLRITFSLILLVVIAWYIGGIGEILSILSKINPTFVILALLVSTLDRVIMTYKWGLLLKAKGQHLPLLQGMNIYCASMVWGLFLPSTVGADAIRVVSTVRAGLGSKDVVASVLIERMVGFLAALSFGLLSLGILSQFGLLDDHLLVLWWTAGVTLLVGVAGFVASMNQRVFDWVYGILPRNVLQTRIGQKLRDFHITYQDYWNKKPVLVAFVSLTFGEQCFAIVFAWFIASGMGIHVGLLFIAGVLPLALLVSRLPVSIDGWGVFDGAFILLMSLAGVSAAEAVAIALAGRILQTASWLPWWLSHITSNGGFHQARQMAVEGR